MIKISNTILLIFMMSFVALAEVPQETPKEIIGQVNPFSLEVYVPLNNVDEDIKVFNENKEELKYEIKDKTLKLSYSNMIKPTKLSIKLGEKEFPIKEIYPNSEISEKAYRDKNFNIFEIQNSYLYNAHNVDEGEYTTIIPTDEIFLSFKATNQPYEAITKNKDILQGKVIITIYDYNGNKLETEEMKLYEANDKIDIPLKEIYHKKFKGPVKAKINWKFDLGSYRTHIYDKEYDISFIKDINLILKCKEVDNIYYENIE